MDYDLSRLSPRSFEQLVQALAAAVIGPGIVVFGDGPDGGREATFEGRMPFPDRDTPWDGYLVVQAKFRQREIGGGNDVAWALAELKKDLAKFSDTKRGLRSPDYYLFATNVILTPVAKTGGKDKVTALLNERCRKHGLKGFRIWDYDQICTLLECQSSVRTAYTAWITAGDVLAAVLEQMPRRQPDFRAVMRTFIHNELRADQYVNLGQAGHREADRTPLARVFVDLPVSKETWKDGLPPSVPENDESSFEEEEETQETTPVRAMTDLLALAAQRLDPASNPRREQSAPFDLRKTTVPGRVVLIGGPGQGKSTLSQFLCQVHRAALLALDLNSSPPPEVMDACELIRDQCDAESLALPAVPRFPLRVVLNHFAKALAEQTVPSLFAYLRARIASCAERDIDADDLHLWLGAYPWLLVLDGLDEVPASSNRSQVLDSIQDFLVIAHNANADLLLVATSRPQGYNDDFAARYYRHRQLLPLDVNRALHYAERLAKERWGGGDPDRVDRVLTRLHRAGAEEATARLMHSPLQVAIMTLLVDSAGEPPRERWRLFSEYYRVIYDRERQRDILAARLLSEYQTDIDVIHQRVALRLQVESERAGGTDATLDAAAFAALVDQRLVDEEHADAERAELTLAITEAALHRLVFLVAPREGAVGFEVRSLQEFMAAQYLTNGSDAEVADRLCAIAPAAHWRNAFLFAAGRCFHERQHLRDTLHTLCCELNEGEGVPGGGDLERATLAGSQLALEILEDGAVARQPAKLKLFARLALRLMDLPPCEEQIRIAEQYQPALEDAYRQEIRNRLADGEAERRLGAWRVLLRLVGRGYVWARSLADAQWPKDSAETLMIFRAATDLEGGEWLGKRWREAVPKLHPVQIIQFGLGSKPHGWLKATPVWARWEAMFRFRDRVLSCRLEGLPENSCLSFIPIQGHSGQGRTVPPGARREWHWLAAARNFAMAPSKEALGTILDKLAELAEGGLDHDIFLSSAIGGSLSWPLQACHTALAQGTDLRMLITAACDGRLGDRTDWEQAEQRWEDNGVTDADLSYRPEHGLPFDHSIAYRGFPVGEYYIENVFDSPVASLGVLLSLWRNASDVHSKWLAQGLIFHASLSCESGIIWDDLDPVQFRRLIGEANECWIPLNFLMVLPESCWAQGDGLDAMATLGEPATPPPEHIHPVTTATAKTPGQPIPTRPICPNRAYRSNCATGSRRPAIFCCKVVSGK
ncbi:hypothetical protein [uncultured Lamprocystis sp.]|uniref:NACHT domain-containing protein n=1 Tax=uncultured Lamprocystis sp. TaxID=543132 RepID=UPI0025F99185|nr:hypothetical protein [uncultured Lamprocystis sp.]